MHRVAELPDVNDVGRATGRHDPHVAGGHDTVDVRFALHYVCRAGLAVVAVDVTQRRLVGATGGRYAARRTGAERWMWVWRPVEARAALDAPPAPMAAGKAKRTRRRRVVGRFSVMPPR